MHPPVRKDVRRGPWARAEGFSEPSLSRSYQYTILLVQESKGRSSSRRGSRPSNGASPSKRCFRPARGWLCRQSRAPIAPKSLFTREFTGNALNFSLLAAEQHAATPISWGFERCFPRIQSREFSALCREPSRTLVSVKFSHALRRKGLVRSLLDQFE